MCVAELLSLSEHEQPSGCPEESSTQNRVDAASLSCGLCAIFGTLVNHYAIGTLHHSRCTWSEARVQYPGSSVGWEPTGKRNIATTPRSFSSGILGGHVCRACSSQRSGTNYSVLCGKRIGSIQVSHSSAWNGYPSFSSDSRVVYALQHSFSCGSCLTGYLRRHLSCDLAAPVHRMLGFWRTGYACHFCECILPISSQTKVTL